MRFAEVISGIIAMLFGIAILIAIRNFPQLPTADVGPAFFPKVIAIILIVIGLLLAVASFITNKSEIKMKDIFGKRSLLALGTIIIFGIYVFLVWLLGFLIATPLLIICLAIFLKGKNKVVILIVSIVVTIAIYYLFLKFLLIPLPRGIFF